MSNFRKHIDDFFREKLGRYREAPPPDVWDDLETRLDGLQPVPQTFPYRWLLHVAMISAILILGISLGRKLLTGSDSNRQIAGNETGQTQKVTPLAVPAAGAAASGTQSDNNNGTPGSNTGSATTGNTNADNNSNPQANQAPANKPATRSSNNKTNTQKHTAGKQATTANQTHRGSTVNPSEPATFYQPNTYHGNLSNPAPEDPNTYHSAPNASPEPTLSSGSNKPADNSKQKDESKTKNEGNKDNKTNNNHKPAKPMFPRFEAGVKTGFESGFSNEAANKYVLAPYIQYNISPKLAIMTQPGIKYATSGQRYIGTSQNYYSANPEDGKLTSGATVDSAVTIGPNTTVYHVTKYNYTQTHDSIVKSYKTGGSYMEFELPILLKYNLTKAFSVYGGVNLVYSKLATITENTYTVKGITRSFDTTITTTGTPVAPQGLGFSYSGTAIADYKGPLAPAQSGYQMNVGYMVGFSYSVSKKWLFDALVEQSPAKSDIKGGYDINAPLSNTYFRLSVGYKLTK